MLEYTAEQLATLEHNPKRCARVLAGPGTGKSTTMVALLDRLLRRTSTPATSIYRVFLEILTSKKSGEPSVRRFFVMRAP